MVERDAGSLEKGISAGDSGFSKTTPKGSIVGAASFLAASVSFAANIRFISSCFLQTFHAPLAEFQAV